MCKRAWRKEARKHNLEASQEAGHRIRHQGRANKSGFMTSFNGAGLSDLAMNLLKRVGMRFEAVV